MLSLIRIKNYAVIDEVEVEFAPGFSVLTGETGAGKSILVDALGLALGDRADANTVRHGTDRAEISAVFECPDEHASIAWLRERGLDDGDSCTLRRLVTNEGRSRAFVNNQPVTLSDLKSLGSLLLDIHGQHAHQSLLDAANQRELLDAHGGHEHAVADVARKHAEWKELESRLTARQAAGSERAAQLELLRFQAGELEQLALEPGEPERLHAERDRLANIDRLIGGVSGALEAIYELENASAYSLVARGAQELASLVDHDPQLREPTERLAAVEIELRELASDLSRYRDRIEADPERLEWVENRLAKTRTLARRHGVAEPELPGMVAELKRRIAELDDSQEAMDALEHRVDEAMRGYFAAAEKLSAARRKQAPLLSRLVSAQLGELGMPHGQFQVDLQPKPRERADATGLERIEFQIRLNPGQPFGPLERVASGGELSRISLAIEVVRSGASPVLTFVFDEVDAGIGGGVAEIVGRRLSQLSSRLQVLCVTHLPQVASCGQRHYRVIKLTDGKSSRTNVRSLSGEERVEELSRMLGGIEITERARAHAAEMIDRAAK
jgi:DNA repair protein RecN (Recombination protein N)